MPRKIVKTASGVMKVLKKPGSLFNIKPKKGTQRLYRRPRGRCNKCRPAAWRPYTMRTIPLSRRGSRSGVSHF
eukprot:1956804-Amphidinium_carterae.1